MTTERQSEANRANAGKSTGPKSARGKRRSSANARRHGLHAPLADHDICRWFTIVMNDAAAALPGHPGTERERAAFALAEAEAHLARCRRAEEAHLQSLATYHLKHGRRTLADYMAMGVNELIENADSLEVLIRNWSRPGGVDTYEDRAFTVGAMTILLAEARRKPAELGRQARILRAHRRVAARRRSKALARWREVHEKLQKVAPKPNTRNG